MSLRSIFGFDTQAAETTGTELNISTAPESIKQKLDSGFATLHILTEERNVGFTNYEIDIKGKKNESVSEKIVVNRSN